VSKFVGDYTKNDVVRGFFNTRKADGTPITLAGTPVAKAYEDSNLTEFTGGITLTVDFDGITGLHEIKVDTSNAAYTAGHDYKLVLTAGTVDSVSVIGANILHFSVQNRFKPVGIDNLISVVESDGSGNYRFKLTALPKILSLVYEGTRTFQDYLRCSGAVLFNYATGLNSSTPIFFADDGVTPRVSDTITAGTRSTTLNP
jgi:hypothetical protein